MEGAVPGIARQVRKGRPSFAVHDHEALFVAIADKSFRIMNQANAP